jgi:hypothetical protein
MVAVKGRALEANGMPVLSSRSFAGSVGIEQASQRLQLRTVFADLRVSVRVQVNVNTNNHRLSAHSPY